MSKAIGPKEQALRTMREARRAREPETRRSTPVDTAHVCGSKARGGKTGTCLKKTGHQGRHQYGSEDQCSASS